MKVYFCSVFIQVLLQLCCYIMRVLTFSRLLGFSALRIEIALMIAALDPLDTPYSTCRNSRIHQDT